MSARGSTGDGSAHLARMEFDPTPYSVMSGAKRDAFDQHAWESSGGGLVERDRGPAWAEPEPWEAMARRVVDAPNAVFACPSSWDITPKEFRTMCSETLRRPGSAHEAFLLGSVLLVAVAASALAGGAISGAILSLLAAMASAAPFIIRHRVSAAHRKRLELLDLDRVIQVDDPSRRLGFLARADTSPTMRTLTPWRRRTDILVDIWVQAAKEAPAAALAAPPASSPAPPRPTAAQRWTRARADFERVESEWEAIVTDPLAALDHAALLDVTRSRTATFVEQFDDTKHLLRRLAARFGDTCPHEDALDDVETAVHRSVTAWDEAKRHARHLDIEALPAHEQSHADRARKAMAVMLDEGAPTGERSSAAREVERALMRVKTVVLRQPALDVIESVKRLAIEAAPA